MRERTVALSSSGKSFSATGWKVGWATAPAPYIRAVQTVKQFLTYTASAPYQQAVAYALGAELPWIEDLRKSLQTKRDRLISGLQAAGFTTFRPEGTYFVQADIRPLGHSDGLELARALPERVGVVAIPSQVFYDHADAGRPFLRFAFCKKDEVIDEAVQRLARL
jgi:N-succinyldiaminopimelate aminotransferase